MASFTLEIWDDSSRLVTFYTIRRDGEEDTETDKFLMQYHRHPRYGAVLQELLTLLFQDIGDRFGAKEVLFNRRERHAKERCQNNFPISGQLFWR